MSRIIAGVFDTLTEAERTREALANAGFAEGEITSFFNNAPGQHAELPTGGDEPIDPKAHDAHKGTVSGAAIGAGVGLAAGLTAGPAALAIAGVGATSDRSRAPDRRPVTRIRAWRAGQRA
jgi:hypothetical protein